jgi:hypothetical protein
MTFPTPSELLLEASAAHAAHHTHPSAAATSHIASAPGGPLPPSHPKLTFDTSVNNSIVDIQPQVATSTYSYPEPFSTAPSLGGPFTPGSASSISHVDLACHIARAPSPSTQDDTSCMNAFLDSFPAPPNELALGTSISTHEKKRHYLECLEQYVVFLHQQLALLGVQPEKLRRVDLDIDADRDANANVGASSMIDRGPSDGLSGPGAIVQGEQRLRQRTVNASGRGGFGGRTGMSSRSIRTLLVYMKQKKKETERKIVAEERKVGHL